MQHDGLCGAGPVVRGREQSKVKEAVGSRFVVDADELVDDTLLEIQHQHEREHLPRGGVALNDKRGLVAVRDGAKELRRQPFELGLSTNVRLPEKRENLAEFGLAGT